jgi:hypothetical protein
MMTTAEVMFRASRMSRTCVGTGMTIMATTSTSMTAMPTSAYFRTLLERAA